MNKSMAELKQIWRDHSLPLAPRHPLPAHIKQIIGPDQDVLMLGVTPDYYDVGKTLTACDISENMISAIWPRDAPGRIAIRADWNDLPFEDATFDCVLGDGSLSNVPTECIPVILKEAIRVLRPGGRLVHRSFCLPDRVEGLDTIREQVFAGKFTTLNSFKLKLFFTCLFERGQTQVATSDVLEDFNRVFPDRDALALAAGWTRAAVDTIDSYKDSKIIYSFLTRNAFSELASEYFLNVSIEESGNYQFAEHCPIFLLKDPKPL